jgi:hypothetical protein
MRNLRLSLLTVFAGLLFLAVPTVASAHGKRDRDHDRMPDKWERAHKLNWHKNDARKDADKDGLRNFAEYKSHTDPQDADSDDDGIKDGNDVAGTVASFDGTTLVITLPDNTTRSGTVTPGTEVECKSVTATKADRGPGENSGPGSRDDDEGDDDHKPSTTPATTPPPSGKGDDDEGDDEHGDRDGDENRNGDDACPAGALKAGAKVHEAELKITSAGSVWTEVELLT